MEIRFRGVMVSGRFSAFLMALTRSSRGYAPSQTEPRPSAVAAMRRFSAAAEQSCVQRRSEMVVSPHTAMQSGAL